MLQYGSMSVGSRIFETLFPGARRTVFAALFSEPGRWWTPEELAGRAGVRLACIQGHLTRLRDTGILREQRDNGRIRLQPNPECQVFAELHGMVTKLTASAGGETILVVEDTAATAQITRILLESWGYRALEAHTPAEALRLFDAHAAEIHLLLTDMRMPQMSGSQLADELRKRKPELRIVFMSGYPDNDTSGAEDCFLAKPFNPAGLSQTIRRALDGQLTGRAR